MLGQKVRRGADFGVILWHWDWIVGQHQSAVGASAAGTDRGTRLVPMERCFRFDLCGEQFLDVVAQRFCWPEQVATLAAPTGPATWPLCPEDDDVDAPEPPVAPPDGEDDPAEGVDPVEPEAAPVPDPDPVPLPVPDWSVPVPVPAVAPADSEPEAPAATVDVFGTRLGTNRATITRTATRMAIGP